MTGQRTSLDATWVDLRCGLAAVRRARIVDLALIEHEVSSFGVTDVRAIVDESGALLCVHVRCFGGLRMAVLHDVVGISESHEPVRVQRENDAGYEGPLPGFLDWLARCSRPPRSPLLAAVVRVLRRAVH